MLRLRRNDVPPLVGAVAAASALAFGSGQGLLEALFLSILFLPLVIGVLSAVRSGRRALRERARASVVRGTAGATAAAVAVAVADERRRMALDIESIVRVAVQRIATLADATAHASGIASPTAGEEREQLRRLSAIQAEGRAATGELRRLLGLLRAMPDEPLAQMPVDSTEDNALRAPRPVPSRGDIVLAGLAVATVVVDALALGPTGVRVGVVQVLVTALAASGVLVWRINPGLGSGLVALFAIVGMVLDQPLVSGLWMVLTPTLLLWAAIARPVRDRTTVAGPVAMLAAVLTSQWLFSRENTPITVVILAVAGLTGAAFAVGDRSATRARKETAQHDLRLSRAAARAVAESRRAAARELHDSISGSVGVMVTQAGAAELLWDKDSRRAQEALDVIRCTAAAALSDLDVLGNGLADSSNEPEDSAARGLGDLPLLLERMRRGGLDVTTEVRAEPGDVSAEAGLTAYRVVQEGLANAMRHASGATVHVTVVARDGELRVIVTDDGPGARGARHGGYGLTGLGERVHRLGGTFSAGEGAEGRGFRLVAVLPLDPAIMRAPTRERVIR
ncbi:MAG: histidine kinase [Ornithinimicrobium sp.]|uniref:sensor histidine kinase n=1 Tax=Ornithinimicrobium sp. TaxID=1977084 RepID=UPI0026DFBD3C|nr:ATP-binding protein [Ornithinimicrobium sp.]MDO5739959.1 histidine kinase [Ornithinimicrobium sp.]